MIVEPSSNFKYRNAEDLVQSLQVNGSNLYLFVSRSHPWNTEDDPLPVAYSEREKRDAWDEMIVLRKIKTNDVILGVRKSEWVSDTVYDEYNDQENMEEKNFYIFTPEKNFYLCISNNNGSPSTFRPTHVSENVVEEPDGYKWKYMANVSDAVVNKFILNEFVPIEENVEVTEAAVEGSIEHFRVENSGSGYPASRTISAENEIPTFIQGNGNQVSSGLAQITAVQGEISSASILDGGEDYFYGPGVTFPIAFRQIETTGYNQTAYGFAQTDLDGKIVSIQVEIPGTGYANGVAEIVQSSAEGYVETNENGEIVRGAMRVGREGRNFDKATAIPVTIDGTGAEVVPVISPPGGFGSNPFEQLYGHFALVSVEVDPTEVLDEVSIRDFRRIGLIDTPLEYESDPPLDSDGLPDSDGTLVENEPFEGDTGDAKFRIVLSGSNANFQDDETIVGLTSGTRGNFVTKFEGDTLRYALDDSFINIHDLSFEIGEQIQGLESGATGTVVDLIDPAVEKYSGDIYHINNVEPITISESQNIVITFALIY